MRAFTTRRPVLLSALNSPHLPRTSRPWRGNRQRNGFPWARSPFSGSASTDPETVPGTGDTENRHGHARPRRRADAGPRRDGTQYLRPPRSEFRTRNV